MRDKQHSSHFFRLRPSDLATAHATGAEPCGIGPEWVRVALFRNDWPKPDVKFWMLRAYDFAKTGKYCLTLTWAHVDEKAWQNTASPSKATAVSAISVRNRWVVFALVILTVLAVLVLRRERQVGDEPVETTTEQSVPTSTWQAPPAATAAAPLPVAQEARDPAVPAGPADPPKKVLTQEEIEKGEW